MATVIRTRRIHQPPSILLQPSPASNNSTPPSSASSASSHSSSATPRQNNTRDSFPASSRRIRFAPLPDPRRAVLITDDGDELPLLEAEDATQFPGPSTPTPAFVSPAASLPTTTAEAAAFPDYAGQDTESIGSSSSSSSRNSKRNSYSTDPSSVPSTPGTATPLSLTTADHDYLSSVPASPSTFLPPSFLSNNYSTGTVTKPKSKVLNSLLRPFKKGSNSSSSGSSHTLTPVASLEGRAHEKHTKGGITKEEILTLGTINLFRASSRESRYAAGNESDPGFSLTRWTSASSTGARSTSGNGAPLARTQSTQSYTSRRPSTAPGFVPPSPSRSKGNQNLNPRMRGARMLNGRVYGAPKRNTNLFANARDEEPEFVEWGYGGMGSVKGARSAGVSGGKWERLQGAGAGAATAKGAEADVEDDGSGMGWVKKRKMEREREKKEREEREKEEERKKAEEKVEVEEKVEDVPEVTVEPTPESEHPTLPSIANLRTLSSTSQSQRPTTPSSTHTTEEEHVLRAVTIPARPHYHHHHHRSHSRGSSKDLNISGSNLSLVHNAPAEDATVLGEVEEREEVEGRRESESSDEEEEKEEEEEEEEEDDNEEIERKRRTAVGAGVEKISRHKEVHDELSPATTPAAEI